MNQEMILILSNAIMVLKFGLQNYHLVIFSKLKNRLLIKFKAYSFSSNFLEILLNFF